MFVIGYLLGRVGRDSRSLERSVGVFDLAVPSTCRRSFALSDLTCGDENDEEGKLDLAMKKTSGNKGLLIGMGDQIKQDNRGGSSNNNGGGSSSSGGTNSGSGSGSGGTATPTPVASPTPTPTPSPTPTPLPEGFIVYDEVEPEVWQAVQTVPIFLHQDHNVKPDRIAPGLKSSYEFIVRNNQEADADYNVDFTETNNYGIDMRYRLRRDGVFLAGNETTWVDDINLVKVINKELLKRNYDTYLLEWQWFDNDVVDTALGKMGTADYGLDIKVTGTTR